MTASIEELLRRPPEEAARGGMRIAREIQMSLLPRGGTGMPGLVVTALCLPAREVGGDYYDFFPLTTDAPRRPDRRRRREGDVGRALHGGAQGGRPVAQEDPSVAAAIAGRGQPDPSTNLDSRSFITMSTVVDIERSHPDLLARRPHADDLLPARRRPPRARVLTPNGMVVGLRSREWRQSSRSCCRSDIPLQTATSSSSSPTV